MQVGYKIGYAIGWCFSKICVGICKLLWRGIVTASKDNRYLLITYICLFVALFPSYIFLHDVSTIIAIICILAIIFGIAEQFKNTKTDDTDRNEYFNAVFSELNLMSKDGSVPYFLYEKKLSEYATLFAFNSFITITEWQKKKESLEMLLNVKILDIKQDRENNRIIQLIAEMKPLPNTIYWDDCYLNWTKDMLIIGIGHYGTVGIDLSRFPHILIAGETGSGKSNLLKCLIHQSLQKNYEVILIDFKRAVSFSEFEDKIKVYFEYEETVKLLEYLVVETKKRLDLFRKSNAEDLIQYNRIAKKQLRRKIIFIDELAELLKIRDKAISNSLYDSIETLARIARSAGIHLIVGIQRPDSSILNGQIKNNLSCRVCFRFTDLEPSRIVISNTLATTLPNIKGRCIINKNGFQEVQSFYYPNTFKKTNNLNTVAELEEKELQVEDRQNKDLNDLDKKLNELQERLEQLVDETNECINEADFISCDSENAHKKSLEQSQKENKQIIVDNKIKFDFSNLNK